MRAIGAVFQPELIELMKAVLDSAVATLPEAKRTSSMKGRDRFAHSFMRRERRARPDSVEIGCALSRRGVLALFARYLGGAPGSLSA